MSKNNNTPPIIKIAAWLLSLIVFAVGFWHAHLGMKEMKPFQSEYGSLLIAAIILLLTLITYWFAVNGKKNALIFYSICALSFFVLNLNYFYPAYMGRNFIKEEARELKDSIASYSKLYSFNNESYSVRDKLDETKKEIITQIKFDGGFGSIARKYLDKFNSLAGTDIDPPNNLNLSEAQKNNLENRLNEEINKWEIRNAGDGLADAASLVKGYKEFKELSQNYSPKLELIATNNSEFKLDSLKKYPDVKVIEDVVQKFNSAVIKINKGNNNNALKILEKEKFPRANRLGTIKHTITSITERINEIDTWAIIFLCLLIDFIVPLSIYLLIKKKENENEDVKKKKLKPSSF